MRDNHLELYLNASTRLLEKIIAEFSYEGIFTPKADPIKPNKYILKVSNHIVYSFDAIKGIYGNLMVEKGSVMRHHNNQITKAVDAIDFVIETKAITQIDSHTMAHFIRELNNTLYADSMILAKNNTLADEIIQLPYAKIEGVMTGHPWFVINKGRIGFSASEYQHYAPEMQKEQKLIWLAVSKTLTSFQSLSTLCYDKVIHHELDEESLTHFDDILRLAGAKSDTYYYLPCHPWQWDNVLQQQFLSDIAQRNLIYLGQSTDQFLPMQSIRTFSNISFPEKYSVKLPLSIFNTAVYRGLPEAQTKAAPLLTEWVQSIAKNDQFLKNCRFILLGELASMYYHPPHQASFSGAPYQFTEQLGVIWRQSIQSTLEHNEKAMTMAALVHVDKNGNTVVGELIKSSGLTLDLWLERFFDNTLPPLLHFLYRYGMVFSPHGENSILLLENGRPVGLAMKDFVDDINICKDELKELEDLAEEVKSAIPRVEDDYLLQFIHTGLFVVHYRYLSAILAKKHDFPEIKFYQKLDDCITRYQTSHPQLSTRFERFNLYKKRFGKLCLNRLRVLEVGYNDAPERPKVLPTDTLKNPLYLGYLANRRVNEFDCGHVKMRAVELERDIDNLHKWMNEEHVAQFWHLNQSKERLKAHFSQALSDMHQQLFILSIHGREIGYAEIYNAQEDRLSAYYPTQVGDYGWHLLIGERSALNKGHSEALISVLSAYCFDILNAQRVLFEPDVRVIAFQKVAPRLGYQNEGKLILPEKNAYLFSCEKSQFLAKLADSINKEGEAI
ncbi:GNAT family N-acetyltransferase [Fangia hongkongensis]|uniref:GNAT family N-acetyltransferase n=1 Tax=Fangia hongkongensis TaxID=270495 RepID=UPI00037D1F85|nr:GNAT family N-acetyltransferase [Fangia hongkongensis]MBK2124694.1 GNAT family N-acetyltransferase [Fangia hongkongensis]